jgi:hypothetical protein
MLGSQGGSGSPLVAPASGAGEGETDGGPDELDDRCGGALGCGVASDDRGDDGPHVATPTSTAMMAAVTTATGKMRARRRNPIAPSVRTEGIRRDAVLRTRAIVLLAASLSVLVFACGGGGAPPVQPAAPAQATAAPAQATAAPAQATAAPAQATAAPAAPAPTTVPAPTDYKEPGY